MTTTTPTRKRRRYGPGEIDQALTALALTGSSDTASTQLGIPSSTLREWRIEHAERYADIQKRLIPQIEQATIGLYRNLAVAAAQAAQDAVELAKQQIATGDVKDSSATAKNLATTAAIATDKLQIMEGRPTTIIEHRSADIMQELEARGLIVDSTADDINSETAFSSGSDVDNARELSSGP